MPGSSAAIRTNEISHIWGAVEEISEALSTLTALTTLRIQLSSSPDTAHLRRLPLAAPALRFLSLGDQDSLRVSSWSHDLGRLTGARQAFRLPPAALWMSAYPSSYVHPKTTCKSHGDEGREMQ